MSIWRSAFLGNTFVDDYANEVAKEYSRYVDTFLYYLRMFENGLTLSEILDLPYCLYNDLIVKQVKLKKQELKKYAIKNKTK